MAGIELDPRRIQAVLEEKYRLHPAPFGVSEVGEVTEAGDGIAHMSGLAGAMAEEMLLFPHDIYGLAMDLARDEVGAIVLGDYTRIRQGDTVRRTCKVLQVPVGEHLLGRIVSALGQPLDGRGAVQATDHRLVETEAPGIVERQPVNRPLHTGLKSVDALTPIGRGQRELIIGDRQTGKTALALDAILNQEPGDVACVYVAVGQKMSTLRGVVQVLEERGRLGNCIVVAATASDSAPMQFIAPFAACAMAEYFRDTGRDALIVYDDLHKHAVAYRQISLLLRRPPGREAFPGDIFYLHSRLLERAAKLSAERGGGSLTALPLVETQEGDYSTYIPTNLISITDGQIYLESDLFHQGFRPAMNVGLSVSRVGGQAQLPATKRLAATLRLEFAQYRELAAFARLTADLDKTTQAQLSRGERIAEILKQPAREPMPIDHQVCSLWALLRGHLDAVPLEEIRRFEQEWHRYLDAAAPDLGRELCRAETFSDALERRLDEAMRAFRELFVPTGVRV
jgi:F-type H+-transporting ATPase subunit alpha